MVSDELSADVALGHVDEDDRPLQQSRDVASEALRPGGILGEALRAGASRDTEHLVEQQDLPGGPDRLALERVPFLSPQ